MKLFANDKREYDADGHLRVSSCNISKANVCPYFGREIPNAEALGLDPNRVYMLYRDPTELARGAASFANKPLLRDHIPVTAAEPSSDMVVGTIGSDVRFEYPYLKASIAVWTEDGIALVESGAQRQLSSSYRYTAEMTRGRTPEGIAYDGRMVNILGNHVALVEEGRAGPDVLVADASPTEFKKMRFSKFLAGLVAVGFPTLKPDQVVALDKALDEDLEDSELASAMDAMSKEDKDAACDAFCKKEGKAMDAMSDEDRTEAYKRAAKDKRAKDAAGNANAPAGPAGGAPKPAQDEAAIQVALDAAVATAVAKAREGYVTQAAADKLVLDAVAANNDLHAARANVAPTVGEIAQDSAESVYRFALDHLKVEHATLAADALKPLYEATVKATAESSLATDSAVAQIDVYALFPGASHIRKG